MSRGSYGIVALIVAWCMLITGCGNGNTPADHINKGSNRNGTSQAPSSENSDQAGSPAAHKNKGEEFSDAITQTIAGMSLDEKIGQLIIAGLESKEPESRAEKMITEQHVGGVIFYKYNLATAKEVVEYVNQLKAWNSENAAPLILSVDQEGGKVSRLPGLEKLPDAAKIGKSGKLPFAEAAGSLLAREVKEMGMNMNYAPVLDINSNPNNPVIGTRSFGATPEVVTPMGITVMKAIKEQGVIPVVKHFPGHGDTGVDSHLELPIVEKNLEQLQAFEWLPFAEAIKQGTDAVMIAHILFPQLDKQYPASLSKTIVTDQLRGTLKFDGVIMTDDLTMGAIAVHYGIGEAAVQAILAGTDIVLVAHDYNNIDNVIAAIKQSVEDGKLTEQRIDESVERILRMKQRYGLTDEPVPAPSLTGLNAEIRAMIKEYQP